MKKPARGRDDRPVLITGGAGFIGANLAHRLLSSGRRVILYDNLSRPGVERNAAWLRETHGDLVTLEAGDVRDRYNLRRAIAEARQVYHFAAQVAVTGSLADPVADFEVNAHGTLNVLEELRALRMPPALVFTSTNKVYGEMDDLKLIRDGTRYTAADSVTGALGVGESRMLSFHSPYGCSKGAADQYALDYARVYGLQTVVFRMSCIYGPHQFGTEDQGWIAHFLLRAIEDAPISIYGDGMQVRDALFVEDLVDALLLAQENMRRISGRVFNIGGGPSNTLSLLELMEMIARLHGRTPAVRFDTWRTGDQKYYVSDIRRFQFATGWAPRTGVREGVETLYRWLLQARGLGQPAEALAARETT